MDLRERSKFRLWGQHPRAPDIPLGGYPFNLGPIYSLEQVCMCGEGEDPATTFLHPSLSPAMVGRIAAPPNVHVLGSPEPVIMCGDVAPHITMVRNGIKVANTLTLK